MAHIRRRNGKFFVEIRKRYGQKLYATFDKLSDARSFAKETELKIQQNRFRDISEASKTSLKIVLHRYLREIIDDEFYINEIIGIEEITYEDWISNRKETET